MNSLGPIDVILKTGAEPFHHDGQSSTGKIG